MDNERFYDAPDEFYCRDLIPLSDALTRLATDGNRYHAMLATRLVATQDCRWLVKPATGFTSPEHQAFFIASFTINVNRGLALVPGDRARFVNGNVYAQLDDDAPLEVVPNAKQPIWGFARGAMDKSREVFEEWHLSGASLRSAWESQGIVAKVAAGDRMYNLMLSQAGGDTSKINLALIQARYPGYLPPDGTSKPELGITGRLA